MSFGFTVLGEVCVRGLWEWELGEVFHFHSFPRRPGSDWLAHWERLRVETLGPLWASSPGRSSFSLALSRIPVSSGGPRGAGEAPSLPAAQPAVLGTNEIKGRASAPAGREREQVCAPPAPGPPTFPSPLLSPRRLPLVLLFVPHTVPTSRSRPRPCLHVQTPFPPSHPSSSGNLSTTGSHFCLLWALAAFSHQLQYYGKAPGPRALPVFEDQARRLSPPCTEPALRCR